MFRGGERDQWIAEVRNSGSVPEGAIALPLSGAAAIVRSGDDLPGPSIIVPTDTRPITLLYSKVADRDGLSVDLSVDLAIDPPNGATGLRLLAETLGKSRALTTEDLTSVLASLWGPILVARAARISWTDEGLLDERLEIARVPDEVQEALFDRGLRLEGSPRCRATSAALDRARESRRRRKEEATRIRERLEFLELWKREEQGEALAREEVEQLATHLRQKGLLRKIEHTKKEHVERLRAEEEMTLARERLRRRLERERLISEVEIDQQRLEKELEQAERLQSAFEKNGWLALVRAIDDPDERNRLLERLIEKEMTPEQLAARGVGLDQVQRLEARIEALQKHLEQRGAPPTISGVVEGLRPVHRVWMAAGLALYRIDGDPATAEREARPVLPPEELGYLRSVRVLRDAHGVVIAVGGQGGVGLYRPEGSHWELYPFRPGETGRGGANSVDFHGNLVVGTHSRLSLNIWVRNAPGSLRRPFAPRLVPGRSTRAIQRSPSGGWWFGHGAEVFHIEAGAPEGGLSSLGSLPSSVTALCSAGDELWAGTQEGRLFRFEGQGRWSALAFGTSGPIYQIVAPPTEGPRVWLVGARQPAVHVLDDQGGRLADYRCRYPVRWVGAGAGGPLAVDRFGQHLIVWAWHDPDTPARRIRVADQIHSIAVEEVTK